MPKLPIRSAPKGRSRKGWGRFGPPGPANIVRFARSLWPKAAQERELCEAMVEAALEIIAEAEDVDLRQACLRNVLDRAYEALKEP